MVDRSSVLSPATVMLSGFSQDLTNSVIWSCLFTLSTAKHMTCRSYSGWISAYLTASLALAVAIMDLLVLLMNLLLASARAEENDG